ncbi:MAG: NACHT domain-containing protein, partial [Chloroflexota bacterium]
MLGIAWGLAEFNYINMDTAIFEPALTIFGALTVIASLFAFSNREKDSEKHKKTNRDLLIEIVNNNWIEGVLHDALRDAQIQVDIETAHDQVDSSRFHEYNLPIETVLKREGEVNPFDLSPQILHQTFKDTDGKLLILGAPGSGKTVLLLQLAEKLLEQAQADPKYNPVPSVFNLSSWANNPKQSIETWVIDELGRNYGAGKKLAKQWVNGDALIYLLDGLDEVAEAHRDTCLEAINSFVSVTRQIVVCSRIEEYDALSNKLKISTAVQLEPLSKAHIKSILDRHIPKA